MAKPGIKFQWRAGDILSATALQSILPSSYINREKSIKYFEKRIPSRNLNWSGDIPPSNAAGLLSAMIPDLSRIRAALLGSQGSRNNN